MLRSFLPRSPHTLPLTTGKDGDFCRLEQPNATRPPQVTSPPDAPGCASKLQMEAAAKAPTVYRYHVLDWS